MAFMLHEPSGDEVRRFLSSQKDLPFSYEEVGATREGFAPQGYVTDRYRVRLGEGPGTYEGAKEALRAWKQFDLDWVRLLPQWTPVEVGATVGVLARHLGFWSLNPARIVYLVEEASDGVERSGFGYGTLPGHAEKGEERFLVEWDREDNSVRYDVFAFSRPDHLLAWPGFPFARLLQKRFARDSKKAVLSGTAARA